MDATGLAFGTGLTSSLSSTKIRFLGDGQRPPFRPPLEGGGVGVIDTKGDTLLTASAKGDKDSGSSLEEVEAFRLRSPAFLVFTILNTISYHL